MNKCIAFVDDDERFLELSREHLTYRGYDVLGYRGTAAVEGHGLGLSFVRSVARFYGGTATCSSEPGKGTTFTVTLPLKAKGGLK